MSEGMKMPPGWLHMKFDLKNIRAICGKFAGKNDFQTVPVIGWFQYFKYQYLDGIKQIPILNYLSYDKKKVTEVLSREVGWEPYEKKHYESLFTRFYQGYILPRKFNIDKRKVHYSTLICSGQIGREEALESMKKEPYEDNLSLERDKEYVLKKLGFSKEEFERYLSSPSVPHTFYPSSERIYKIYKLLQKVRKMLVSK